MWNRRIGVEVAKPTAVIPAKAGIHGRPRHMPRIRWAPAFAGVTLLFWQEHLQNERLTAGGFSAQHAPVRNLRSTP
jgi:hypothetical protein